MVQYSGVFAAPALEVAPCGLFSVANVTNHTGRSTDERWVRGYSTEINSAPTSIRILNDVGGVADEGVLWDGTDVPLNYDVDPFTIEVESKSSGMGLVGTTPLATILKQLEAASQKAVERELWEGAAAKSRNEPVEDQTFYLTREGGAEVVTGGGVDATRAMSLLEQAISNSPTGAGGVIHMTRDVAATLIGGGLSYKPDELNGGFILSSLGTPVVVGSGYTGAGPDGVAGAAPSATNKWIYVTGAVDVHLSKSQVVNEDLSRGFDTSTNDSVIVANRAAAVHFDPTIWYAAQVTLPPVS